MLYCTSYLTRWTNKKKIIILGLKLSRLCWNRVESIEQITALKSQAAIGLQLMSLHGGTWNWSPYTERKKETDHFRLLGSRFFRSKEAYLQGLSLVAPRVIGFCALPSRILNFYREALTEFYHEHGPDGLITTLLS